ncbi:ATP-binding protein [Kitasatospora sp. NPDC058162]|uniref:ATP-binding protein n=1 Tax=Kitasatospora sp. NPDC058162 TaxID=3346362 RepID=UPI0036DB00ED
MHTATDLTPVRRHRHLGFAAGNLPVSEGLAFTRQVLADWHLAPSRFADDVQLVAAELLTNAVRHAGGALALDIAQYGHCLRIAVTDPASSTDLPRPGWPRSGRIGGYGLVIVERLALRWGASSAGRGKTVWADLGPLPPPAVPST